MTKGRHIRAIGDGAAEIETGEIVETVEQDEGYGVEDTLPPWNEAFEEPVHQRRVWPIILSSLAALAVLGWTAFYAWANREAMLVGATPGQWIGWATQWTVPVLLVAVAWLIAMRSSAREATRFGDAARVLSQESALLETRLVAVNRELSLAREFLAAQSRELDYLGRSAAERISEHAGKLQALVADNGAQVDAIAGVSVTALENMAQLRDNLPVIANSARDVTNQIGGAGRSAKTQLGELIAGFERLNEFGQASERQVVSLRERIDASLEDMAAFVETMDANNAARAETLRGEHDTARSELEARETEVHDAMRKRGEALRAELVAAHDARQLEEAAALAAMRGRIASFTREAHDAAATVRATERAALEAWESQVAGLRERLERALQEVSTLDQNALDKAREKLAALTAEAEAVDTRLSERDRSFAARLAERQAAFDEAETAAFARLTERAAALDSDLAASHESQTAHADTIGERSEALAARVAEIDAHIASVADRSAEAERALASSSEHFATAVSASSSQLGEAENTIARLTDSSVRLLELIQAAASHSRSELPAAIEGFEGKLGTARESSSQIRSALEDARRFGDELNTTLADMHGAGETAIGNLDAFRTRLTGTAEEQTAALSALRAQLVAAGEENRALTESISGELHAAVARMGDGGRSSLADLERGQSEAFDALREKMAAAGAEQTAHAASVIESLEDAVARLKDSSEAMLADLENDQGERVTALAAKIGEESAQAIDRAIEARTEEAVAKLDEATARSADASREAIANLRDQLARVHELTGNLETRAARAREQVEEQVDNDFSRRMALITESLNSHSIDIAKALSTEVTDTAWASYLKGDRGVFTRRAVRLVDNGEAREISQLYEGDHEFREHVSRYIHDFEAMLRTMLSTRDGHALGVTLLSSDMGKLYVALAQAIQRLRQ